MKRVGILDKLRPPKGWQAVASALLLLLAFPPFRLTFVVFVALVPWLIDLKSLSGWRAWRSGYLFGLVTMLGQMAWVLPFVGRWTGSWALATVPWILSGLICAFYFGLAGVLIRICWNRSWWWAVPIAWAGVEVFRSYIPTLAFPWALIASPLHPYPAIIQLARDGTIYLVGAWVVWANVLVAQWMTRPQNSGASSRLRWGALGWLAALCWSFVRYSMPIDGDRFKATICQPGIDEAFGDRDRNREALREAVAICYVGARAYGSQLMVLPEGVSHGVSVPPETPFAVEREPPLVFGGSRGSDPEYQDAFAFDGREWTYADKTRLVVFGEYVPFRKQIPFLQAFNLPSGDLKPGSQVTPLRVGPLKVGPLLCFEGLFSDVALQQARHGARLLTVMSIDDWYMGSAAPEQLASAAVWRAIETGVPVLRSATLGYSMAVDQRGNVLARAPLKERYSLPVTVVLPRDPTPPRWEPIFPMLAALSLPILLGIAAYSRRRY